MDKWPRISRLCETTTTGLSGRHSLLMPELPDISAYLEALHPRIIGQRLEQVRIVSPFVLRTASPPLSLAEGRTVVSLRRAGKRIGVELENGIWIVLHLMIAGRLHWRKAHAAPGWSRLPGRHSCAY